jgi:hypothetical protein
MVATSRKNKELEVFVEKERIQHRIVITEEPGEQCTVVFALIVTRLPPTSRSVTINAKTTVHCSPGSSMVCGPCLYFQNSPVVISEQKNPEQT